MISVPNPRANQSTCTGSTTPKRQSISLAGPNLTIRPLKEALAQAHLDQLSADHRASSLQPQKNGRKSADESVDEGGRKPEPKGILREFFQRMFSLR